MTTKQILALISIILSLISLTMAIVSIILSTKYLKEMNKEENAFECTKLALDHIRKEQEEEIQKLIHPESMNDIRAKYGLPPVNKKEEKENEK